MIPQPEFVNVLGTQESIPRISSLCIACWTGTSNRVVVRARLAGNLFLGSLKGLQIRALLPDAGETLAIIQSLSPQIRIPRMAKKAVHDINSGKANITSPVLLSTNFNHAWNLLDGSPINYAFVQLKKGEMRIINPPLGMEEGEGKLLYIVWWPTCQLWKFIL